MFMNKKKNKITNFDELIEAAGGRKQVMEDLKLSAQALSHYRNRGIPRKYWTYFAEASGVTIEFLHCLSE